MTERITTFICAICGKPVHLAECEVTDIGDPVHESCLTERINEEKKKAGKKLP